MSKKEDLRKQRENTIINEISSQQEKELDLAITMVQNALMKEFEGISLKIEKQWFLKDVIEDLKKAFPNIEFHHHHLKSSMRPDGGILSLENKKGELYPILITEKKNQGTNDSRISEGKKQQAKGNAIERLGKNVIGFRTALLDECIFPFICFGDGCDFSEDSTILDRVTTIAMFGELNKEFLYTQSDKFNRGSFYFRVDPWTVDEMFTISMKIAIGSVYYYFSKYGKEQFITT
jgi:type II restriction enzyme